MGVYWLASYPKSGNTWFRSFLKNYLRNDDAPLSIDDMGLGGIASSRGWIDEILGFDSGDLREDEIRRLRPEINRWEGLFGPDGYHKTHDAYTFLPDGTPLFPPEGMLGAVYILRNPLDVAVSYSHFYLCSVDQAIEDMGKRLCLAPSGDERLGIQVRQDLQTWSEHVAGWADAPGVRVEILRYEDMKSIPVETFSRAIRFLKLPVEPDRLANAIRFSDFAELRTQEESRGFRERPVGVTHFFRKGMVGEWKNVLTDAQVCKIISDHGEIMARFGYLDSKGNPQEVS